MNKKLFALSSMLLLFSCATNDIIYEDNENPTQQNFEKKALKLSKTNLLTAKTETVLMDMTFLDKIQPSNGGCTITNIDNQGNPHETTAAFGPNPLSYFGYQIRGYGAPRMYWGVWNGLRFEAKNRSKTIISRGHSIQVDDPLSNAISIEFPFEENFTYEITIEATIYDEIYIAKHDQSNGNDHLYEANQSESFPKVAIELKDSPQIPGNDPCAKYPARPVVGNGFASANNYKSQKAEIIVHPSYEKKTFVFNFSTKSSKNALLLYFLPQLSENQHIPESSFSMYIGNIKIVRKTFDPSHVVEPIIRDPNPCGFRGGC